MVQPLITPDTPALATVRQQAKRVLKKQESTKVLKVGVQIPLPQIIRKLRGQYLQGILLKREIVLLFIMPIILLICWLNKWTRHYFPKLVPLYS
jgi:hypothetical protein